MLTLNEQLSFYGESIMAKQCMGQHLTMVEHAAKDPRSVSAMLKGNGDGREHSWLDFEKMHAEITDQALLMAQFSHEARYGRVRVKHLSPRMLKLVMGLVVLAIIVF